MKNIGRREFLEWMVAAGFSAFAASVNEAWGVQALENPLAAYPHRDWERPIAIYGSTIPPLRSSAPQRHP